MAREKIILGNKVEVEYSAINFGPNCLIVSVQGGDITQLEATFRNAGIEHLESITQADAEGNVQNVHERYDLFTEIKKTLGATPEADVVDIVLTRESEIDMKIRHLENRADISEGALDEIAGMVESMAEGM